VSEPTRHRLAAIDPQDRRIRRSWWFLGGSFAVLGLLVLVPLAADNARPIDFLIAGLVVVAGVAAILHRNAVRLLEIGRRAEAESFARILQGLSRSVSPDAIVAAIVEDLGVGTGADHIVVVRRRHEANALEATLVSTRPGVPSSTTLFPLSDLDDQAAPAAEQAAVAIRIDVATPVAAGVGAQAAALGVASGPGGSTGVPGGLVVDGHGTRRERSVGSSDRERQPGARAAERIAARVRAVYGLKHTLAAPLRAEAGVVGAIVISRRTADPWPASAHRILAGAAVEASAALARAVSHREAEARASTDALTGLPNRRYFDEFCGLLARRRRADDAVGVLMVDIDRFKVVNDTRGHGVGDEVLRAVGAAIAGAVREDDVPARFGGEEFAVLLRNPTADVALEVGERVRAAVGQLDLGRFGVGPVTVSVGVAVATAPDQPIGDLVEQADRALYEAKRAGRDRVVAA